MSEPALLANARFDGFDGSGDRYEVLEARDAPDAIETARDLVDTGSGHEHRDVLRQRGANRVDDALHATRAAVEEGIVAGGGVALVRAIVAIADLKGTNEDETIGIQIVKKALEAPLRIIADNSGMEGSVVLQQVLGGKKSYGYNARTDIYEDLKKAGVIDPTKVTRIALENAASISGMVLTTECVISDKPEPAGAGGGGHMPHGGGMPGMM